MELDEVKEEACAATTATATEDAPWTGPRQLKKYTLREMLALALRPHENGSDRQRARASIAAAWCDVEWCEEHGRVVEARTLFGPLREYAPECQMCPLAADALTAVEALWRVPASTRDAIYAASNESPDALSCALDAVRLRWCAAHDAVEIARQHQNAQHRLYGDAPECAGRLKANDERVVQATRAERAAWSEYIAVCYDMVRPMAMVSAALRPTRTANAPVYEEALDELSRDIRTRQPRCDRTLLWCLHCSQTFRFPARRKLMRFACETCRCCTTVSDEPRARPPVAIDPRDTVSLDDLAAAFALKARIEAERKKDD